MTPKNNIVGKQIQELPLIVKNDIVQSSDTIYPRNQLTYALTDNIPTSPSGFYTRDQRKMNSGQKGSKNAVCMKQN